MIRIVALFTLLLFVLPATAWACFPFDTNTYPSEFAIGGVFVGTLLRLVYAKRLEHRVAFSNAILFSSVIGGFGMGFFLATTQSAFNYSGYTVAAGLFTLLELVRYSTLRNKAIAQVFVLIFTGFLTYALLEGDTTEGCLKEVKRQQFNEVIF